MSGSKKPDGSDRFPCLHQDCGRSFARKEHLSRHALSHADARYVCSVCGRQFTRSDSLQRHIAKHGDAFKPSPSGRSKRACIACHASKTKCDGNESCSKCVKRGLDCIYEPQDVISQEEPPPIENQFQTHQDRGSELLTPNVTVETIPQVQEAEDPIESASRYTAGVSVLTVETHSSPAPAPDINPEQVPMDNGMNWVLNSRIEKDLELPEAPTAPFEDVIVQSSCHEFHKRCHALYFLHFHHRWTIIHRPTYNQYDLNILTASIVLIGAWLEGSHKAKEYAISTHVTLMDDLFMKLSRISSKDVFRQSLPVTLCQAALLNVIFGLYCGRDTILSRAIILRNTLVGALREVGLFTPGIPYDKPGDFLGFRLVNIGDRSRLAAYLYKIDTYFNLLRCRPALLVPEDLTHYPLPSTYSLYNSDGLDVWDSRLLIEPPGRTNRYIHRMMGAPLLDAAKDIEDGLMLVEDIQLGLCAMYSRILDLSERLRHSLDINNAIQRDVLRRHLDFWNAWLAKTSYTQSNPTSFTREMQISMRFYYGYEDHSVKSKWEWVVFDRARSLHFDATMLYHLLCLNLYADIRTLRQAAQDLVPSSLAPDYGEPYKQAQKKRQANLREFTRTHNMRRALCHSSSILTTFKKRPVSEKKVVDPISYVAISTAALMVWACCLYGDHACELCSKTGDLASRTIVDISKFSDMTKEEIERDTWIENGGGQVALQGIPFCLCMRPVLAKVFQDELPEGWDGAFSIAPGVFEQRGRDR